MQSAGCNFQPSREREREIEAGEGTVGNIRENCDIFKCLNKLLNTIKGYYRLLNLEIKH